jgi:pimeloyl-ACP methyl ester carboxylesterase
MTSLSPPAQRSEPAAGAGRPRRRGPAPSALVAAGAGVLAAAAGAGLGVRHLQKTGLSLPTVVGLALLAAGLALLVLAGVMLWRAARGWRRLWLLPGALAAVVAMWAIAFAVMVTVVPPTALSAETPAARGMSFSEVTLRTTDGVRLSAWWVPSTNRAAVVLLHGAGENRTATLPQAAVLARHGYGVLMLDARGHGRSGGRGMDLGWYGDRDVAAAVEHLHHRTDVDGSRVAVLGLSMGGEEAIGAAAADPRIRAVVVEGATGRTAADKAAWLPGGVSGVLQRGVDWLTYAVVDLLTPASPPSTLQDAVARARSTPFLLITAGTVRDEARAAAGLQSAAPERVQVWTVPGASHTHALGTQPAAWETRVTAFLDDTLGRRTAPLARAAVRAAAS